MQLNMFHGVGSQLDAIQQRLINLEDQLCGETPKAPGASPAPPPAPQGILPSYEYHVRELSRVCDEIESTIARMQTAIGAAAGEGALNAKSR